MHLVLRMQGGMQIFAKTLTGKMITLEREDEDSGQGAHPPGPAAPHLRGKQLEDGRTLADNNI
jgi:ubiquitin C